MWSVWLVPLLSTGEGSTVAGYGLGGGCKWSEVLEDLLEKTLAKLAGELGESVKGLKADIDLSPLGDGMSRVAAAMTQDCDTSTATPHTTARLYGYPACYLADLPPRDDAEP